MVLKKLHIPIIERIRNIEILVFFLLLVFGCYFVLSHPQTVPKELGEKGIFFYLVAFLLSFIVSIIYFMKLIITISIDTSIYVAMIFEKNKKWIGIPIVLLSIVLILLVANYYFEYELKNYIGEIVTAVIIAIVLGYQKIIKWIADINFLE